LLEELYPEENQLNNCRVMSEKKRKMLNKLDPPLKKKRVISYLAQKGYTWEIIERVV
jgi:SOS response regulatory protein OraA/RecX